MFDVAAHSGRVPTRACWLWLVRAPSTTWIAAREYAQRPRGALADELQDNLLIVMRAYFEKPQDDGRLEGSDQRSAPRRYLRDRRRSGHCPPAAAGYRRAWACRLSTEALDPITPQYLQDLISWSAIGARTTESQTHREMASGLSSAVIGIQKRHRRRTGSGAECAAVGCQPHSFLGINTGRPGCRHADPRQCQCPHRATRRQSTGPNYDAESISRCESGAGSGRTGSEHHGGTAPMPTRARITIGSLWSRVRSRRIRSVGGNRSIIGLMIESNLEAG